jgi:hypothetical protein
MLTPGEQLLIWRRRMGWNQSLAAAHYGVSLFNYKLAEYDKPREFKYKKYNFTLRPYEKCLIYRKRSGKKQKEVAKEFGIGRYWLRLQEIGEVKCVKLLDWWERIYASK